MTICPIHTPFLLEQMNLSPGCGYILCGYKADTLREDLNTDLAVIEERTRDDEIVAAMEMGGLEYLSGHFLTWKKMWLRDGRIWCMCCRGREV